MLKFRQALSSEQLGLRQTLEESGKLLAATLEGNHTEVARLIEELYNEKIPFSQYNDENCLACVFTIGYLYSITKWLAVSLSSRADRMPQSGCIPYGVVRIIVILNNGIHRYTQLRN